MLLRIDRRVRLGAKGRRLLFKHNCGFTEQINSVFRTIIHYFIYAETGIRNKFSSDLLSLFIFNIHLLLMS